MITQGQLQLLKKFFQKEPVTAVYLFGSRLKREQGPLSDLDFAILFSMNTNSTARFNKKIKYFSILAQIFSLPEDRIDIVDLNKADFPIAFSSIGGKLIYEKNKMERVNFEVETMARMATDFYFIDRDYKLMIDRIKKGRYFYGT